MIYIAPISLKRIRARNTANIFAQVKDIRQLTIMNVQLQLTIQAYASSVPLTSLQCHVQRVVNEDERSVFVCFVLYIACKSVLSFLRFLDFMAALIKCTFAW